MTIYDEKGRPKNKTELNINKPVQLTFQVHVQEEEDNFNNDGYSYDIVQCVFWDFQHSNWSSEGCQKITKAKEDNVDIHQGINIISSSIMPSSDFSCN